MKNALMPVSALLLGVSLLLTGQGLQSTLLPVRASLEAFGALPIGVIGGAHFLGFTLGCLKGGDLVARVGHVRVFAAMTALASAAPLLHGLVLEPLSWTALRFLTGFCFAVLYVVIESWLNEVSTNANRSVVFSTYVMLSLTMLATGQLMMLMHDPRDLHLFAIAAVLVSIAVIPVVLSTAPQPQQPHSVRVDLRRLLHISPAGALGSLCSGLTGGAFWSLAPVFALTLTGSVSLAAWFMSANVLGGALVQWPLGLLSDRVGRRAVLIACALAAGAIGVAILLFAEALAFAGTVLLGAAWGAASFPQYSISVANANDYADPSEYVMLSSGLLLLYGLGAIAGPLLASLTMIALGDAGLYLYTAVVHLGLSAYIAFRLTRRAAAGEERQVDFSESLVAAHTQSQVYEEESLPESYREGA